MCLLAYTDDSQSTARIRRGLALIAIVLLMTSFLIGRLHVVPGSDTDLRDFLRGLTVGIGLVFSVTAFTMCLRRPRANS